MMVGNWTKIEGFERTQTMDLVDEGKPCVRVGYVRERRSSEDTAMYSGYEMTESKSLMTETLVIRLNYCRIYRTDAI